MRQMLLLKQDVLPEILSSPGAYLCLNWAMGESKGPLTKAAELIYSLWHLADEPPSPASISPDIHSPSLLSFEWHILVTWAIPLPASDLPWRQEEWHTSGMPSSPLLKGLTLRSLLWTINLCVYCLHIQMSSVREPKKLIFQLSGALFRCGTFWPSSIYPPAPGGAETTKLHLFPTLKSEQWPNVSLLGNSSSSS